MARSQSAKPQHTATHRHGCWTGKRERHGELLSRLQGSNNSGVSSKEETFTALAAAFRFNDAATFSQHGYWHEDWCAERNAELDLTYFYEAEFPHLCSRKAEFPEFMCLSCGIRPGAEWLGDTECYECYSEH